MGLLGTKYCTCGYELEAEKQLHVIWLDDRKIEVELCICPRCGRYSFYRPGEEWRSRCRAECGGKTDEELRALLESDAPALLRDAAREVLTSRAECAAEEQRRCEKKAAREQERTADSGFFSGLFGRKNEEDGPRRKQPPEF